MSLLTEIFGEEVLEDSLAEVKRKIKSTPYVLREKRDIMLKEYAEIKGLKLFSQDFLDVQG